MKGDCDGGFSCVGGGALKAPKSPKSSRALLELFGGLAAGFVSKGFLVSDEVKSPNASEELRRCCDRPGGMFGMPAEAGGDFVAGMASKKLPPVLDCLLCESCDGGEVGGGENIAGLSKLGNADCFSGATGGD